MARHPWQCTLREFVQRVEHDYGLDLAELVDPPFFPSWPFPNSYLRSLEPTRRLAIRFAVDEDEELHPFILRSLCCQIGVPPEDFGLDPEE